MTEPSYADLRALIINCTLKRSPELSHTGGLIDVSTGDQHPRPATVQRVDAWSVWSHR